MRLEIIIDKKHGIGLETIEALANELNRQLTVKFVDLSIRVATGSAMSMSISKASKEDKVMIEELVQDVWENSESWMPEH
nr:DinI-like family protein [uncultured Tolumonas sp.]